MGAVDRIEDEAVQELTCARALDPLLVEALADEVSARIEGDELEHLVAAFECSLVVEPLPWGWWGLHRPALVLVSDRLVDVPTQRAVGAHEGAHNALIEARLHHKHGDVWAVGLAVLMPRAKMKLVMHLGPFEVAIRFRVPFWAAVVRIAMLRAIDGPPGHGCERVIEMH